MEVVAVVVAAEAVVFVIAFGATLAVGWRAVVVAGIFIVLISAFIAAQFARGGSGSEYDFSPHDTFYFVLFVGGVLYVGLALGVVAANWARSWAARRG